MHHDEPAPLRKIQEAAWPRPGTEGSCHAPGARVFAPAAGSRIPLHTCTSQCLAGVQRGCDNKPRSFSRIQHRDIKAARPPRAPEARRPAARAKQFRYLAWCIGAVGRGHSGMPGSRAGAGGMRMPLKISLEYPQAPASGTARSSGSTTQGKIPIAAMPRLADISTSKEEVALHTNTPAFYCSEWVIMIHSLILVYRVCNRCQGQRMPQAPVPHIHT